MSPNLSFTEKLPGHFSREFLAVMLWTLFYAFFVFWGLGDVELSGDEGIMAMGGKRVAQFGCPRAWDGKNLFSWEGGYDLSPDLLQIHLPWLGFYLGAMGQILFGENPFGARFGFALCGALNLPLIYLAGRRLGLSRSVCALSVFIMTSLASYFLYTRQCYHYPADITFCLLGLMCYSRIEKKWNPVLLALCVVALFHLNHLTPLWLAVALTAWAVWDRKLIPLLKRPMVWAAAVIAFLGTWSWIQWANIMGLQDSLGGWRTFLPHFKRAAFVLSELDMSFPLLFSVPLLAWCGIRSRQQAEFRPLFRFAICVSTGFLFFSSHQYAWLRFFLFLFVVGAWLWAVFLIDQWRVRRKAAIGMAFVFFVTTLFYQVSHRVIGFVWPGFARYQMSRLPQDADTPLFGKIMAQAVNPMLLEVPSELAAPPLTSMGEAVRYLQKHARDGEKIVMLCDQQIIQFRTSLVTVYLVDSQQPGSSKLGRLPSYLSSYREADWILLRNYWKRHYVAKESVDIDQNMEIFAYFQKSGARLEPVSLRVREQFPVQMPNLFGHIWATDFGRPSIQLYRVNQPR